MKSYEQYCGLALALDRIGDRWTLLVVRELLTGPKRFSDLVGALPGVATNLLAGRLEALESHGLIERRTLPPPAASAVYVLTDAGLELEDAVHALVRWGGRFMRRRSRRQAFRPHWLGVAVAALLAKGSMPAEGMVIVIDVPEGSVTLGLDGDHVRVLSASDGEPDVRLVGRADHVLGLVSGGLGWDAAVAGIEISGREDAVRALRAVVETAAVEARASRARAS